MEEQKGSWKGVFITLVLVVVIVGLLFYLFTNKNILGFLMNKESFTKLDKEYTLNYQDIDIPGSSYQIIIDKDLNITVSNLSICSGDACLEENETDTEDQELTDDYFDDDYDDDDTDDQIDYNMSTDDTEYTLEFSNTKKAIIKLLYINKIFGKSTTREINDYINSNYVQNFINAVMLKDEKYIKLW